MANPNESVELRFLLFDEEYAFSIEFDIARSWYYYADCSIR
jgi:hypothetical protein